MSHARAGDVADLALEARQVQRVLKVRCTAAAAVLFAIVVLTFRSTLANGWVDWGDAQAFLTNTHFRGWGAEQLTWAFSNVRAGAYQPFGWILASAESQAFGLDPRGWHLVSLLLYAFACAMLLPLLLELTTRFEESEPSGASAQGGAAIAAIALVAAIYAVHPTRVELAAWASSQSYLCSTILMMASVLAYLRGHRSDAPAAKGPLSLAFALFVTACLFHPCAASLPLVLVVLDADPLRRLGDRDGWFGRGTLGAWMEKAPYFAVSFLAVGAALWARGKSSEPVWGSAMSLTDRVGLAGYNVWFQISTTLLPRGIGPFYPRPDPLRWRDPNILACVVGLVGVTAALGPQRVRHRGLTAAWFAYLAVVSVNLAIGLENDQAAADRHSFVAMLGFAAVAAGVSRRIMAGSAARGFLLSALAFLVGLVIAAGLGTITLRKIQVWKNSMSLWRSAANRGGGLSARVRVNLASQLLRNGGYAWARDLIRLVADGTPKPAYYRNLTQALDLLSREEIEQALEKLRETRAANPGEIDVSLVLAATLERTGRPQEAVATLLETAQEHPDDPYVQIALGKALLSAGRPAEAIEHLALAAATVPDRADAWGALAAAFAAEGRIAEAHSRFAKALGLDPDNVEILVRYGNFLIGQKRRTGAIAAFDRVLRQNPDNPDARLGRAQALELEAEPAPVTR